MPQLGTGSHDGCTWGLEGCCKTLVLLVGYHLQLLTKQKSQIWTYFVTVQLSCEGDEERPCDGYHRDKLVSEGEVCSPYPFSSTSPHVPEHLLGHF